MQLVEAGAFAVDTPVSALLPGDELDGLFDTQGTTDAAGDATVHHLLAHTAGVADYFEGRVTSGRPMRELVIAEPDRLWTPADLLDFTRSRQRPVGRPGERFAYSNTGYILLGRLLEHATGRAFHELLQERIFIPLGMQDSALLFHSRPANDEVGAATSTTATTTPTTATASTATELRMLPFRLGRDEASTFRSVSCDWAGGGIVSTPTISWRSARRSTAAG